uniref:DNA-directed RNA polymerase n=1 Tax=Steinernema glaseri TaxID=37863 RepID=A0A1I7ZXL6_9BILA
MFCAGFDRGGVDSCRELKCNCSAFAYICYKCGGHLKNLHVFFSTTLLKVMFILKVLLILASHTLERSDGFTDAFLARGITMEHRQVLCWERVIRQTYIKERMPLLALHKLRVRTGILATHERKPLNVREGILAEFPADFKGLIPVVAVKLHESLTDEDRSEH